jgi:pimeloyl-ACP methyl ester carboxylesterase
MKTVAGKTVSAIRRGSFRGHPPGADARRSQGLSGLVQKACSTACFYGNLRAKPIAVVFALLLLYASADTPAAEQCFRQALEASRRQAALLWELRAATSLGRRWLRHGKCADAVALWHNSVGNFHALLRCHRSSLHGACRWEGVMIHRLLDSLILLSDRYSYQVPADLGLVAEAVSFPNARGGTLTGLFCQPPSAQGAAGRAGNDQPVVLFCPGTAGNLSSHLHYMELLCRAGLAVLGFDYSGFGRSTGQAALQHLITDVLSACDFLRQVRNIERLGLFGVSIGANVALHAAVLRPACIGGVAVEGLALQREIIRGLLTEGSMGPHYVTTITYDGQAAGPRQPHVLQPLRLGDRLADVVSWAGAAWFPFQAKDPQVAARALADTPVLFVHGVEDPLLPCEATLQVYSVKPGAKRLWLIPGVGHAQEPILAQDAEYAAQLGDFFHQVLQSKLPAASRPPAMTCELLRQGPATPVLRVHNPGPPGLALCTVVQNTALHLRTVWVQECLDIPVEPGAGQPMGSCLRLFEVAGSGDAAGVRLTPRGQRYRERFQPCLRALSRTLHESRLAELAPLLEAFPQQRPEPPFDFFLGLYCVQVMLRCRRRLPPMARAAAEIFRRYWHYGAPDGTLPIQPTLWELVSTILGKQVGPEQTMPVEEQ